MLSLLRRLLIYSSLFLLRIVVLGLILLETLPPLTGGTFRDEVALVISPGGTIEASLVEVNGGATTSMGYEVRLRPTDGLLRSWQEVASLYGAVRNDCAYGVNLRWTGPRSLVLEYLEARSAEGAAFADVGSERVSIALRSGVADPNAPCGGMDYNLRGRPYG